ncbi:Putative uncharacterized protein [Thermotoga neapolitana DSM 4359]|uniref:Uncharacterized protein n=1 Tax=Thermotoga neapolitana (strain ATCC 49049 / DSM 4359 / NBRC 107923 / NS-E) TaxID=309803 RepID=B9K8S9_THENN|nr:Putative uncharacterized protein [Thermotoga neapolitana DSM 4359]
MKTIFQNKQRRGFPRLFCFWVVFILRFHTSKEVLKPRYEIFLCSLSPGFHTSKEVLKPAELLTRLTGIESFHTSKEVLKLTLCPRCHNRAHSFHTSKEVLKRRCKAQVCLKNRRFPYLKGSIETLTYAFTGYI